MCFQCLDYLFQHIIIPVYYNMVKLMDLTISKTVAFYVIILLIIIVEAITISFLKRSLTQPSWAIVGVFGYSMVALMFREVLKFGTMGEANAIWNCGAIILVSFIGYFFYGDTYTPIQLVGIGLAALSTFCMVWGKLEATIFA